MKKQIVQEETHPLTWRIRNNSKTVWIQEYKNKLGYIALKNTLKDMSPKDVVNVVRRSELRGRGGGGFCTGIKWELILNNKNNDICYLICNADEMEPGTYKDRFLMERIPHLLIEGIILSSFALGASCSYIFLRGEYVESEYILEKAILESRNSGYIGKNILGSGFDLEVYIHTGAGRYICGEETALINSLEGKRANPRFKPPFPGISGLWGKPTCVNNVETLSNIPGIMLYGVDWYKKLSYSNDTGTKLMGFSGRVNNPGVWEVPFGITAREILEKYAGGMQDGFTFKAWQPGGASTDFLTFNEIDTPMDFENIQKVGSRLGTGLAMVVDDSINMVSLVLNIERFFSRESCGWCTPCREGLPWIVKILEDIVQGIGRSGDIEILEELCSNLSSGKAFCAHAPGAIEPLQSAIKYFRKDFELGINVNIKNRLDIVSGIQCNFITG
ncbi:NADH dehydrogenase I subunit F [Buchnera aphidicola (Nipponaphis monzeni)]|uniref:NADH-quinone oxidoreductase subunit F n=1 Tax=Buchnera aphidicola (Nipponaphis monzeni) TaxID=2495405 RepID=A0A455T9Y5_9GAMM|nr:NADH-quinone oxidoreductase subunit NuoF [Buchnera aphidicola]BBI01141.1 NADH dehydrogenase I subunit F [Buchnera aphidicola (Nipponaphis monzeni)]